MMPKRLLGRLVLLLAAVLTLNTIIGLALVLGATRETTLLHTARSLHLQIIAADALLANPDRAMADARLRELGVQYKDTPPPESSALALPFFTDIAREVAHRMPDRRFRIIEEPQPTLWVSAAPPNDGWIGIPLLSLRGALRWSSGITILCAFLVTFAAAAWYARSLVRPLRTLAAAAPGLAAGEPAPPMPKNSAAEISELGAALNRAANDTRTAARERQLVLAGLSHDMRTPLARLVLALELLGDGDAAIRQGMSVDLSELDSILEQFISYVRDGRDEPGQVVDLSELLDDALAAQRRSGREWQRRDDAHVSIYAKPLALRRALANLLENAACHGAAPLEVELVTLPHGAAIRVRDRGPGVAADVLPELGRPFYRADAARTRPGSGLGLATVARIAAWHGGNLNLRNRDGGGFEAELILVSARA